MTTTLNARQEAFAAAYVRSMNATQAAKEAGYSVRTAGQMGYENLKKPEVQKRIEELQAEIIARNDVDADRLVRHLYLIATADMRDLAQIHLNPCTDCWPNLGQNGPAVRDPDPECRSCRGRGEVNVTFTPADRMSLAAAALYKGMRVNRKSGTVELLTHDKLKAIDMLMRHLGLYRDQEEVARPNPLQQLIAEISARGSPCPIAED